MLKFIITTIILTFFSFNSVIAQDSKSNVYLIESISSKAVAKKQNDAKNIAIANARRDAFMVLVMRLKLPISISDTVTDSEISDMVRSEQIVDEKISGNSYSATFNIIFAKDFVEHILSTKSETKEVVENNKSEKYAERFVIIPVKVAKRRSLVWEPENDWRVMLERVISKNSLEKTFAIPEANIENVATVNGQNVKNISFLNLEKITNTNNSEASYILFFNFDEIENKVLVDVIYLRKLLKKQFRLSFINVDRLSYNDLIIKVAEKTLDYLKNNSIGSDNILNKNTLQVHVKVKVLEDWLNVKKLLENANISHDMLVNSISRDEVRFSVNYINPNVSIEEACESAGIKIAKQAQGFYEINAISQ